LGSASGGTSFQSVSRTWFKGAFSYYIPGGNSLNERFQRFEQESNRLLGTRLTPDVVWNLAPWSWAADWFGNVGDVIHNVSSLGHDGLTLRYGYVMSHQQNIMRSQKTGIYTGATAGKQTLSMTREVREEWKKRFPATPYYGFAASGALNETQSAILIALGISHMR
jgi:hypothetical protein